MFPRRLVLLFVVLLTSCGGGARPGPEGSADPALNQPTSLSAAEGIEGFWSADPTFEVDEIVMDARTLRAGLASGSFNPQSVAVEVRSEGIRVRATADIWASVRSIIEITLDQVGPGYQRSYEIVYESFSWEPFEGRAEAVEAEVTLPDTASPAPSARMADALHRSVIGAGADAVFVIVADKGRTVRVTAFGLPETVSQGPLMVSLVSTALEVDPSEVDVASVYLVQVA